jgi:hypothetical protein
MGLQITPQYAEDLTNSVVNEYIKRQGIMINDKEKIEDRIKELKISIRLITDKIRALNSETQLNTWKMTYLV